MLEERFVHLELGRGFETYCSTKKTILFLGLDLYTLKTLRRYYFYVRNYLNFKQNSTYYNVILIIISVVLYQRYNNQTKLTAATLTHQRQRGQFKLDHSKSTHKLVSVASPNTGFRLPRNEKFKIQRPFICKLKGNVVFKTLLKLNTFDRWKYITEMVFWAISQSIQCNAFTFYWMGSFNSFVIW